MTPIILWSLNESNATSRWERRALSTVSLAAACSEAAATVYSLSIYTAYFCLERHTRTQRLRLGAALRRTIIIHKDFRDLHKTACLAICSQPPAEKHWFLFVGPFTCLEAWSHWVNPSPGRGCLFQKSFFLTSKRTEGDF